jgi:hypothetical protein
MTRKLNHRLSSLMLEACGVLPWKPEDLGFICWSFDPVGFRRTQLVHLMFF